MQKASCLLASVSWSREALQLWQELTGAAVWCHQHALPVITLDMTVAAVRALIA